MIGNILQKESYLAMIHNAEGTKLFRNLYMRVDDQPQDILNDGQFSCAAFASFILHSFFLIETPHATVAGLERDLMKSGWRVVEVPQPGDVLVWEPILQTGSVNAHVGFCLNNEQAMSNSSEAHIIGRHHMTYGVQSDGKPVRAIATIYRYDFLA